MKKKASKEPTKECKGCGETKPISAFRLRQVTVQGKKYPSVHPRCRPCEQELNQSYLTPEKIKENNRIAYERRKARLSKDIEMQCESNGLLFIIKAA